MLRTKAIVCFFIFGVLTLLMAKVHYAQQTSALLQKNNILPYSGEKTYTTVHLPREYIKIVPVLPE